MILIIHNTDFRLACLNGANLTNTDLSNIDLTGSTQQSSNISASKKSNVTGYLPFLQSDKNKMIRFIQTIIDISQDLIDRKTGCLIVFEQQMSCKDYIDVAFLFDLEFTKELIFSILLTPHLCDGGVLIRNHRIAGAGALLPQTQNPYINKEYGAKYRGAIGLSEETDAIVLTVSRKNQKISFTRHGALTSFNDMASFKSRLGKFFNKPR